MIYLIGITDQKLEKYLQSQENMLFLSPKQTSILSKYFFQLQRIDLYLIYLAENAANEIKVKKSESQNMKTKSPK